MVNSFQVDHTRLIPGVYISRKDYVGGDVVTTYDIRMKAPNREPVMETGVIHTLEHIGATFLRMYSCLDLIYFGPMGCRTGFYLVVAGKTDTQTLIASLQYLFTCVLLSQEIPGATEKECGNAADHDLPGAKAEAKKYLEEVLTKLRVSERDSLQYPDQ